MLRTTMPTELFHYRTPCKSCLKPSTPNPRPAHRQRFWCAPKVALVRTQGCFAAHQSCRRRVGAEKGARGRAEGVEVILDPMGQHFTDDLQEHIDRIRSSPLAAPGVRGAAPSVPPPKNFSKFPLAGEEKLWYYIGETWKRCSLRGRRAGDSMQM